MLPFHFQYDDDITNARLMIDIVESQFVMNFPFLFNDLYKDLQLEIKYMR